MLKKVFILLSKVKFYYGVSSLLLFIEHGAGGAFTWVPHWRAWELLNTADLVLIADTMEDCISMRKA